MKIEPLDLTAEYKEIKSEVNARIARVIKSGRFILDREGSALESSFARMVGTQYAIAVGSGSDALHLSLMALGIGKGDEVITSPFSFIATPAAIVRVGAKPVFVDIDPNTFQIDTSKIQKAITSRTKAILPVHLYGSPSDMSTIMRIANQHRLRVIEDCAQSAGARWKGKMVGGFGACGAFSFYPTKTLGAFGDGGMITTNDSKWNAVIRSLRNQGANAVPYQHERTGVNSRLDEIQAAVLNVKLKRLTRWNVKRRQVAKCYCDLFHCSGLSKELQFPAKSSKADHVFHQYPILTKKRDHLLRFLRKKKISVSVYYPIPLHLQPCFRHLGYQEGDLPVVEDVCDRVLNLPIYPQLKPRQQKFVVTQIEKFFS